MPQGTHEGCPYGAGDPVFVGAGLVPARLLGVLRQALVSALDSEQLLPG